MAGPPFRILHAFMLCLVGFAIFQMPSIFKTITMMDTYSNAAVLTELNTPGFDLKEQNNFSKRASTKESWSMANSTRQDTQINGSSNPQIEQQAALPTQSEQKIGNPQNIGPEERRMPNYGSPSDTFSGLIESARKSSSKDIKTPLSQVHKFAVVNEGESKKFHGHVNAAMGVNHSERTSTFKKVRLPTIPFPYQNHTSIDLAQPRLWIYVQDFKEGMASWRPAFAEILIVAKALNAVVVEPCIERGYLTSCYCCQKPLRLSDIYEMEKLQEFHHLIAPFDDYEEMLATQKYQEFKLCMHSGTPPDHVACSQGPIKQPVINYSKKAKQLEQLLQNAVQQSSLTHSVLDIVSYRRETFLHKPYKGKKLVGAIKVRLVSGDNFVFRKEHFEIVAEIVSAMGISGKFNAVHWRAEQKGMDYMSCAEEVIRVRTRMYPNQKDYVLLSSLNEYGHLQWSGTKRFTNDQSQKALTHLMNQGFKKTDTIWQDTKQITDVVLLAVWDLILAMQAENFATCSNDCGGWCAACGHRGNFAKAAIRSRLLAGQNGTHKCWPTD